MKEDICIVTKRTKESTAWRLGEKDSPKQSEHWWGIGGKNSGDEFGGIK